MENQTNQPVQQPAAEPQPVVPQQPVEAQQPAMPQQPAQQPYQQTYAQQNYQQPYQAYQQTPAVNSKSKIAAGIFGILLGAFGIHKFYLGYTTAGVITLLITLLTLGFGGAVMGIIGLIEGILYLCKSDEEFYQTYVLNKRAWF